MTPLPRTVKVNPHAGPLSNSHPVGSTPEPAPCISGDGIQLINPVSTAAIVPSFDVLMTVPVLANVSTASVAAKVARHSTTPLSDWKVSPTSVTANVPSKPTSALSAVKSSAPSLATIRSPVIGGQATVPVA